MTGWRRMRETLLPAPLLSAMLLVSWLLLNRSFSVGHLLLGGLLALLIPAWSERLRSERPRARRWATVLLLAVRLEIDIVVSNIDVARRVLGPESQLQPRFVWIPLRLRDSHAIAALATMITLTPGTLSSELTPDQRHLLVHVLHCPDDEAEAELVATIRSRYEDALMEIFE